MHTAITAILLATAPASTSPTPTDRAAFDVSDAEVVTVDRAAHVVTYDAEGENSATLSVWIDDQGRTRLDADFADGLYMSVIVDGDEVVVDSPDAAEVAARAHAINDWVGANGQQLEWPEWTPCAVHAAVTAGECAVSAGLLCAVGVSVTICECLPLLTDEVECW